MEEIILRIIKIGLPLSVIASMFGLGLRVLWSEVAPFRERPLLMLRSIASVILLVPLAALCIILLLKPAPGVAIGLAILLASPAAPMQLVRVVMSKEGSLPYMVSLHLSLALLALVTVPATLYLFSLALGFQIEAGVLVVAKVVGATVLAPLGIGILLRAFYPRIANAIGPAVSKVAMVVLLISLPFVIAMTYRDLFKMQLWSYFSMVVVVVVSLSIGHLLGPLDPKERTTLAMESASRGLGLALTIAMLHFSLHQVMPVLIPYAIVFTVISAIYLRGRKWSSLHASPSVPIITQDPRA